MERKREQAVLKRMIAVMLSFVFVFTGLFPNGVMAASENTQDGLILYYDFNLQNSFSTMINDASGHENTGNLKRVGGGSVEGTYSISDVNLYGTTVKALSLPGGDDGSYLQLPDGILADKEAVTISMWVKLTTDTGYQRIWDMGNDTTKYMYLLSDGGNPGHQGYAAAITTAGWQEEVGVEKQTNIDKNRWVLTTVVMDGTKMSLYENGAQIGTTVDTGISLSDLGATTGNYIGYGNCKDAPTKGQFAEVKIYDRALSADEIAAMYTVDDAGIVAVDKAELELGDLLAVTEDITLPMAGVNGSTITWQSENSAVTIEEGVAKVTRPAAGSESVSGKLIATITLNDVTDTKEFEVTVIPNYTDKQIAEYDAEWAVRTLGDLSAVMTDLTLPVQGERGSVITWTSEHPSIAVEGSIAKVTRPAVGADNATGTLKASISCGEETVEKQVTVTVLALREAVTVDEVEEIKVETLKGHSPSLPNYAKVTYTDGSKNKIKTIWPDYIDKAQYSAVGTFRVEGSLVGESKKVVAEVTVVEKEEVEKQVVSSNFDLSDISLDKIGENGSILTQNRDRDITYLKLLDKDRMLYNFYKTFGEDEKIKDVQPLGGWDEPTGLLRGHSTGHYMSALALAYASTGDEEIKANLDYVIHELREMQKKSAGDAAAFTSKGVDQSVWSTDPSKWGTGFISAYSPDQFALLEKYTPYAQIWAPYYTLHKLMAGFLDAYTYTGNEEALEVASELGKWVCNRLNACSEEQLTKMWDMYIAGEFGGFNESLAQLYIYTNDPQFLAGAKLFDNTNFFNKLKVNVDDIATRHANQHIPQIVGAMKTYEASVKSGKPEVEYYDIARNFWQMTVSRYAYSIGGVGTGEKFTQPYQQANSISGTTNCETCAAYNMLKLTKMLNNYDPDDAEYMDYYERTLYNQILASQTPNVTGDMHNGTTYMLPIGPGSTRSYGDDYRSFTCCHGTGMENHVKYQEAAYVKTDDTLYVGLYLPTTVTWEEKGVVVKQETTYPSEDTKLTVSAIDGKEAKAFDMKLRVPYWATNGFDVTVNGEKKITNPEISTYVTVEDVKAGDVVEIHMPYTLHLDKTPDLIGKSEVGSVMYGPFVMAAQIDDKEWKTLVLSANLSDSIKVSKDESTNFPTLTANGYNFAPMFDAQFATKAYDAYFKILTANDDGSKWFEAKITNTTPKKGSFTIDADMVKEGGSLVITAVPNDGYMVKLLTINGKAVSIGEDNTYTVTNVNENLTIEGSFRLINPPTPDPKHLEFTATASSDYTAGWETVDGIMADWEPTKSAAGTGKGWGNWPQDAGSEHYVQYEWDTAVEMDTFQIYWYDDGGDTAIPGSLKIMYLDENGSWSEAAMLSKFDDIVAINQYNKVEFEPITTTAVKLVMTVKDGKAANGILRWKVSKEQGAPIETPSEAPSEAPSVAPSEAPSETPSETPSVAPSEAPSVAPSETPAEANKTALKKAIDTASKKSSSAYTKDSFATLTKALTSAKKVMADKSATQKAVDSATTALNKAIKNLKLKPVLKTGDTLTYKGVVYKVTNAKSKSVTALKPQSKKSKSLTIYNTVKMKDTTCKVTAISSSAFTGMKNLTKVTIPSNVKVIGSKAFYNDSKLSSIKISGASVTSIGKYAFKGIAKKATIDVPNSKVKTFKKMLSKAKTASTVKIK